MRVFRGWAVRAAGAGCVLALAACAGIAPSRESAEVDFAPVQSAFEASGRLSVRHGTDALTANFRWNHDGVADIVDLASPLGQTVARLTGDASGVSLRTADGRSISAANWRELGTRSLDWSLPVDGLAFWIQGAPRTGAPFAVEAASDGAPSVLRQDGWTIVYQSFAPDTAGVSRPARMALSYPEIELKLVVDSWR